MTMRHPSFMSRLKLPGVLLVAGLMTACSNYQYKDHQGD